MHQIIKLVAVTLKLTTFNSTKFKKKKKKMVNVHSRTVQHLDIIRVFYLPTDAQESCFKKNIKICIKTAPTCFGLITIIRERII
jgi:hypothetical protein